MACRVTDQGRARTRGRNIGIAARWICPDGKPLRAVRSIPKTMNLQRRPGRMPLLLERSLHTC